MIGDYVDMPKSDPLVESRQWLVICKRDECLIADDHSTNGSRVLAKNAPGILALHFPHAAAEAQAHETVLDWGGDVVCELNEGDVLANIYAGFVYGRVPAREKGFPSK